jgi:hypothetical protein
MTNAAMAVMAEDSIAVAGLILGERAAEDLTTAKVHTTMERAVGGTTEGRVDLGTMSEAGTMIDGMTMARAVGDMMTEGMTEGMTDGMTDGVMTMAKAGEEALIEVDTTTVRGGMATAREATTMVRVAAGLIRGVEAVAGLVTRNRMTRGG